MPQRRQDRRPPLPRPAGRRLGRPACADDLRQLRRQPGRSPTTRTHQASNMSQMQGLFSYIGGCCNDGRPSVPPVSLAQITDGTSNTMLYGEHAHSRILEQHPDDFYGINRGPRAITATPPSPPSSRPTTSSTTSPAPPYPPSSAAATTSR
ncbi:MAG: DUF1559 domain-containing protein [Isosphaeraceae bacterium]